MAKYTNAEQDYPRQWAHFLEHARYYPGGVYVCPTMDHTYELEARDPAALFQMLVDACESDS